MQQDTVLPVPAADTLVSPTSLITPAMSPLAVHEQPDSTPDRSYDHATLSDVLNIQSIYLEPGIEAKYSRARDILARFPGVERIEVPSHWKIPGLHGNEGNVEDWLKIKKNTLVLGTKKSLAAEENDRSSDFTAPSHANGCALSCAYCVAEGTLISTPAGRVPVEQIADGDTVFAYDATTGGFTSAQVAGTASRTVGDILHIQVNGGTLHATDEHPIRTPEGWVNAGTLQAGDLVLCGDSTSAAMPTPIARIDRVQANGEPIRVYNFHVPQYESYIANGVVTHNCYVPRRKGFANPITTFVNIEQITGYIERHAGRQGMKLTPTTADPTYWVYEIGNNNDCSVDALISDNVRDLVDLAKRLPNGKMTFATKFVNRGLLDYDPQEKTRIRFSLMPQSVAKVVDVRTSRIADRIGAINDFVDAGWEVNINFAPVIYYEGWQADWLDLFGQVDAALSPAAKAKMWTEIIFLTHNDKLHEVNLGWHPKAEDLLWKPQLQETKYSQTGGRNLRYKRGFKSQLVQEFTTLMLGVLPYFNIRYAF